MVPNIKYIQKLASERGWSQTKFAAALGMSRAEVSRLFNGRRRGGMKLVGSLIRVFPNEPLDKLFFLQQVVLKGNDTK